MAKKNSGNNPDSGNSKGTEPNDNIPNNDLPTGTANGAKGDPNRDVQPWLGWVAAVLVVIIVVVAVAMGMERTNSQRSSTPEVRMTPLVGGMAMPAATTTGEAVAAASEVTAAPAISGTSEVTMVTVITSTSPITNAGTNTGTMTSSSELTPTNEITATGQVTNTANISGAVENNSLTAGQPLTATSEATATSQVTTNAVATTSPAASATQQITATPAATVTTVTTATAIVAPPATATPATTTVQRYQVGDNVVPSGGSVAIYADAAPNAMVLDSYGPSAVLEVLDPDMNNGEYPVVVDGQSWIRVRASDGLVGWVKENQVKAQ